MSKRDVSCPACHAPLIDVQERIPYHTPFLGAAQLCNASGDKRETDLALLVGSESDEAPKVVIERPCVCQCDIGYECQMCRDWKANTRIAEHEQLKRWKAEATELLEIVCKDDLTPVGVVESIARLLAQDETKGDPE